MKYPCTGCGACCKMVGSVIAAKDYARPGDLFYEEYQSFPFDTVDGACSQLQLDNTCGVYDNRPDLCNIDTMYKKYFSEIMSLTDFYQTMNVPACNSMIAAAGLNETFLIKTEQ